MVIVCLGGSAGALEAFERFFLNMPDNSGMAFVLIQHIDPEYSGILVEIIQRYTPMKVYPIEDGIEIEPNCVYIIPPDRYVSFFINKLKLTKPTMQTGMRLPIDYFLKSLAHNHSDACGCVIFSGMGTDGTLGIREIKRTLGMVMVQEPSTCKYDSMPLSAIQTELVDFIAPPNELPALLLQYICFYPKNYDARDSDIEKDPDLLRKIHSLLNEQTGHDFSLYKHSTFYRRIERRMCIHQIRNVIDYIELLTGNKQELDLLFKELLIGVTSFFRDQKVFKILKEETLPSAH